MAASFPVLDLRRALRACLAFLALATLLGLTACGGSSGGDGGGAVDNPSCGPQTLPAAKAQWTYMVYVVGDNDLSNMATLDLKEILAANSSEQVRVPVMLEQSTQYTSGASTTTQRGLVTKSCNGLQSMGRDVNMADKQTLTDFINWAKTNYPAERYGLVLWSHGGGWKADKLSRGALIDSGTSSTPMSVQDMASAIQAAGGVDLINFDACLMGMYEVAYQMRSAGKVLVASEESIPGLGNPYTAVLNRLVATPGQDVGTLARGIVSDYDSYYRNYARESVQLAAIDLSQVGALHQKVQTMAAQLNAELAGTGRQAITAARDAAPFYDYESNKDLAVFADGLANATTLGGSTRSAASALASAARAAVLSERSFQGASGRASILQSSGLAIYVPKIDQTNLAERTKYASVLDSNAGAVSGGATWSSFVDTLIAGESGSGTVQTTGAFAYYITWDNPAVDLDLYVNEPSGEWAGPYYGSTSTNGFSSGDSYGSGSAFESYTANETLDKGNYDVYVSFAGCHPGYGSTCGSATASIYRFDPNAPHNDSGYVKVGQRVLSAATPLPNPYYSGPYGDFYNAIGTGAYSDWWLVNQVQRDLGSTARATGPTFGKRTFKSFTLGK